MKIQEIKRTLEEDVNTDTIKDTTVLGLQQLNSDVYELKQMTLSSYLADSTPGTAAHTVRQIRASNDQLTTKREAIQQHVSTVKAVTQQDLDANEFEKQDDAPIALTAAIDSITTTYITRKELQEIVNDVYSELWTAVNDMLTTGFQTSMYARQYTGTIQGIDAERPAYSKIVFDDDE